MSNKGTFIKKWTEVEEQQLMDAVRNNHDNLNRDLLFKQIAAKLDRTVSSVTQRFSIIVGRGKPKNKPHEKRSYTQRNNQENRNLPAVSSKMNEKSNHVAAIDDTEQLRIETAKLLITKLNVKDKQLLLNYLLNV